MKKRNKKPYGCPKCGGDLIKQPSSSPEYFWLECHNMKENMKTLESKYCGWRKIYKDNKE